MDESTSDVGTGAGASGAVGPGTAGQRILGIVETSPRGPWSWRDRRFVLQGLKGSALTHFVYASEADPLLWDRWREPFPDERLARWGEVHEERRAVLGVALAPDDGVAADDPAEMDALRRKVDQFLDVGFELVVLRFDRHGAKGTPATNIPLAAALASHVGDRADLVVVPAAATETWTTPELAAWDHGLPEGVLVAWGGPDRRPERIDASDLERRGAVLGGRPPVLWDGLGLNDGLCEDQLPLGPYRGRDRVLLDRAAGWLVTAPQIARATVPVLASFSGWVDGRDPEDAWRDGAGPLRTFVEACEGSLPRRLVGDAVAAMATPRWWASLGPLLTWSEEAGRVRTPLMGHEVAPWRRQVRVEAGICSMAGRIVQLAAPLATLDADGSGRVLAPDMGAALSMLALTVNMWRGASRRSPVVMGERAALDPRFAVDEQGTPRLAGPLLVEGRNATDQLVRSVAAWLAGTPSAPVHPTVDADGRPVEVADDGTFRAPPGTTVTVRWGDGRATEVAPGWTPPVEDDPRLVVGSSPNTPSEGG